ncbi:hypothetical protein CAPTEDRAFT_228872 [Capitella teleta]|uniref:NADH dehydrogenase [ubiquinone] 1 subunit C2 n=1 Tax=Capitella teleta TaxID=283909 RepID=R7TVH3_CAPTE|nr:hypothetical protein CAPTEDRAFT_228872 [Capitella teleta]|eukprot:ELT95015.1 hypothetical protein CAPTEDRAFT_228872 [Capitella teleta]
MSENKEFEPLRAPGMMSIYCTGVGVPFWVATNYLAKRPLNARIPVGLLFMGAGFAFGKWFDSFTLKRAKERDLIILDYVRQHPEDFPEMRPQKYKDVLLPWHPQR